MCYKKDVLKMSTHPPFHDERTSEYESEAKRSTTVEKAGIVLESTEMDIGTARPVECRRGAGRFASSPTEYVELIVVIIQLGET